MKNKYRGGRPKGGNNNLSSGKKWNTEEEKKECWQRAEAKLEELGYSDGYGHEEPSRIKARLHPNLNSSRTYSYMGDQDELWAYNVDSEELLKIAYGEK